MKKKPLSLTRIADAISLKTITFFVLLLAPKVLFGQEYLWHKHLSGTGSNNSQAWQVDVDHLGNSYVVGDFQGTINFGGLVLTAASWDMYFAKYNSAGALIYVKQIGAANGIVQATGARLYKDGANNIFLHVSGTFKSRNGSIITVNFDPDGNIPLTIADAEGDAFVAKYNSSGGCVFATRIPNTRAVYSEGGQIAVDNNGVSYVAGYSSFTGAFLRSISTSGSINWDLTNIGVNANDVQVRNSDIFVCGYSLGSNSSPIVWYNTSGSQVGSTGSSSSSFNRMSLDASNNIYVVGSNITIQKFTTTSSSTPVWSRTFTSGISGFSADIAVGNGGDVMVTGWFRGTADFNSGGSYSLPLTSSGSGAHDNIFVARYYASSGNAEWVKNNTSNTGTGQSNPMSIACHNYSFYLTAFVLNRVVNAKYCGTPLNVDASTTNNAFVGAYSQRLFAPAIHGPTSTLPGETEEYDVYPLLPGVDSYSWIVPPGWSINYYGGAPLNNYIFTRVGNNSGNVASRAQYECGNSSLTTLYVNVGNFRFASVFPNPVSDELTIVTEDGEPVSAVLINADGVRQKELVYDPKKDGQVSIGVNELPEGIYYIKFSKGKNSFQERIQVRR